MQAGGSGQRSIRAAAAWIGVGISQPIEATSQVRAVRRLGPTAASGRKSVGALIGACLMTTLAQPAAAQEIANVKSVDIAVQGQIAQRCGMGAIATTDFGELSRPGLWASQRVQLDCNVPFTMRIKAEHGALVHSQMPQGQGPYAGSIPYRLDVEMPVRRPQAELISRAFDGRNLAGGQSISSNGGIAMDGLLLRLSLGSVTSQAGLLAGNYGEVIEITIAPN